MMSSRLVSDPSPGWYKMRAVKNGPWLPARLDRDCYCTAGGGDDQAKHDWQEGACDRYPHLQGVLDGRPVAVHVIWTSARKITQDEHQYITEALAHDRATGQQSANADQPVALDEIQARRFEP